MAVTITEQRRGLAVGLAAAALLAIGALAAAAPSDAEGATRLVAKLRGIEVVPGPGPAIGRGKAEVTIQRAQRRICFALVWRRIQQPVRGHIHRGERGRTGRPRVQLFREPAGLPGPRYEGCAENVGRRLLRQLLRRPGRFYVDLHNAQFPNGAIRGQLQRAKRRRPR